MASGMTRSPGRSSESMQRVWMHLVVLAWGAQAIVAQSLLLREALVLMFGSELAWGIVLFAWLLGVALGAILGGLAAKRIRYPEVALAIVLLLLGVAACVEIWVFRGARAWLGVGPGELLPLPQTVLAAVLCVSPVSTLVGLAFPLACCVQRARRSSTTTLLSFARVYAIESAGSLVGGAAFSFWAIEHLAPIQTALLCAAATALASAGLLATWPHRGHGRSFRPAASTTLGLAAVAALVTAVVAGNTLNRQLVDRRWCTLAPGYDLVAEADSKHQNLAIGQLEDQYTLFCDGQVATDFPDPRTFAPQAHFWLCEHPAPRHVLLLGGGAEGLLTEVLRHPIEHVDYVEIDAWQIELIGPFLTDADRIALEDPRVTVHYADARRFVKTQRDRFDLVIARLPEPTSALRARLYTTEFFGELRRAMTNDAVVGLTVTASSGEFAALTREYVASVRETLSRHFPCVVVGWGDPAPVLAATRPGLLSIDSDELAARYQKCRIESPWFDPLWFAGGTDWLTPEKIAHRAADLNTAQNPPISTDLRPVIYMQRLALWEASLRGEGPGREMGGLITELRSVKLWKLVAALLLVSAIIMLIQCVRSGRTLGWKRGSITLSVGTTGFTTMALSIIWLFAFQHLYGYVYQRVGWIIALFMAGLVIGCLLAERRGRHTQRPSGNGPRDPRSQAQRVATLPTRPWWILALIDVLLAILALLAPRLLPALAALQSTPSAFALVEGCISAMVLLTGLLGGAAFTIAARLRISVDQHPGRAAGSVVGADHIGACLGALLCGIVLVPVFGTATAAYLLAGVKLSSAALVASTRLVTAER